MELSEEEKKKFMSMVADDMFRPNGEDFIKNISKISYVCIDFDETSSDKKEKHINELSFTYPYASGIYPVTISGDNTALDFIVSIINKSTTDMRIIYSSDTSLVYSSNDFDNANIEFSVTKYSERASWISLPMRSYCLYEHGAIICDEILKRLCTDADKKHDLLKEYVSHPESISKEIREKIKPIYDELPASEKLLLELDCDV